MTVTKESKDIFVTGQGKEFDNEVAAIEEDARETAEPVVDTYLNAFCADNKVTYIRSIRRHLMAFVAFNASEGPRHQAASRATTEDG